ncbi:arylamine N-acetyltransferase 2 [Aspergillus steynii IBT 23096]|uniref:Arylamine N-acetyltransferase 2 n=1 Tax=Aspergillus steynii IBT 23096 TaxID=1392250 RepID=A0A2I2G3L5_9EURO|nr:arylamine N-acetyltransferase 2 [Aspergillus steynii IBT 23096]PLB47464.1 arylamine N-acetyltransferase 2 [Aspergillus steynii IBT 23096]
MQSPYSTAQLVSYLKSLALPPSYGRYIPAPWTFPQTEEALTVLFRCQLTRYPYENLALHNSSSDPVSLEPDALYQRMLGANDADPIGRGGYCLEVSIFFYYILRGLRSQVYMTGARNRDRQDGAPVGEFKGWVHIVNIVQLPTGARLHLDAAFGGDGPTSPLPLISGHAVRNLGMQEVRLVLDSIPHQSRTDQKMWIYQYRNGPEKEWMSFYCFAELEWFPDDFEVINRFTSWEVRERGNVIAVRFLRSGEKGHYTRYCAPNAVDCAGADEVRVVGKIMMVNHLLKINMGDRTQVIQEFDPKTQQAEILEKWFSISL